jgi:hypothetical protein
VPDALSYEQLLELVDQLRAQVGEVERVVVEQVDEIATLKRRLGADSSNSSRPPSSGEPWDKAAGQEALVTDSVGSQAGFGVEVTEFGG